MGEPRGRVLPRRFGLLLAAVPLVAVLLADAALLARRSVPEPAHTKPTTTVSSPQASRGVDEQARARTQALRDLLARRGDAVVHHDRAEWLGTLDPQRRAFRRQQASAFDNLRLVPIASWT